MIIFIERENFPDKKTLKQQFKFLTDKDIDSIYTWMGETRQMYIQDGKSMKCTIQQVYKYSGVIITNDYLSEFRTWTYIYDKYMFQEQYASETRTLIIYELHDKTLIHQPKKQKNKKIILS